MSGKVTPTMANGKTGTVALVNTYEEDKGSLKVTKGFEGISVDTLTKEQKESIVFKVTGPENYDKEFTYAEMTDGVMTLDGLATGEYTVIEAGADELNLTNITFKETTYSVKDGKTTVVKDETAEVTVTNTYEEDKGSLKVTKGFEGIIAKNLTKEQKESIVFKVTGPEDYEKEFTYAEMTDGVMTLDDLTPGEYTVIEVGADELGLTNFVFKETTYSVEDGKTTVVKDETAKVTVTNKYETSVKVSKVDVGDHSKELEGAHIQILDENGKVVEEWDSKKEAHVVEGLKTGEEYTLRETVAPDGYTVTSDTTFMIGDDGKIVSSGSSTKDKDGNTVLLVEDAITRVKVSKVDVADNSKELEGAHIQILDENGKVIEEWDSKKEAHVVEGLKTGEKYTLRETVAPDGYTVTSDTVFTIDENGKVTSSGNSTKDKDGNTVLLVEDAITKVSVSKVDVADGKELEGAHIQILDKDGKVVEEWDSKPEAHVVEGLKTGETYTLRETVAPKGYDITSDTTFTIDENGKVKSTGNTTKDKDGNTVLLVEDALLVGGFEIEKIFTINYNTPEPTVTPEPTPAPTPTPEPENPDQIDIPVKKEWDDNNNADGNRPESITVRLMADGELAKVATLSAATGWSYTFEHMPRNNGDKEIVYTVKEDKVAWYEAEINGTTITNHYKPVLTSISVRKIWDDDDNKAGMRPTSLLMTLNNGMTVILNAENGWSATISDLPTRLNGQPVQYSWTEQETLGYSVTDVTITGNTVIFTNTLRHRDETPPEGKPSPKKRGSNYLIIEDYGTPLGVEVVINHVGDCFD